LPATPDVTVNELILAYWQYASARYVDSSGKSKKEVSAIKSAMRPLSESFGSLPAVRFGPRALAAIQRDFVKAGYCRTVVNDHVRRVRRIFKWATANEMIPSRIFEGLRTVDGLRANESVAREPRDVTPVPEQHIEAVLPHISRQVKAIIRLQLLCGARPAEITMLRMTDIDCSGALWLYHPRRHKTMRFGKTRQILLGPKAQSIIRDFLKKEADAFLFSPADVEQERRTAQRLARRTRPTPSELRRRSERSKQPRHAPGAHYTTDSYRLAIWRACDAADAEARGASPPFVCERCGRTYQRFGYLRLHSSRRHAEAITQRLEGERVVPRWSPNQLRHNFATCIRRQFGLDVARVLLGHSTVNVTEHYAEIDRGVAADIMGKVG